MSRSLFALAALVLLIDSPPLRADAFDYYVNPLLAKVPEVAGVKELKKLPAETIIESGGVLPNSTASLLVVQTNDGRFAKLLVQSGRKRLSDENRTLVPILLIERYVTYRPGTERTIEASGQNVMLFDGFHFSLDMGQVVPEKIGGDLRFSAREKDDPADGALETVGKAKMYLLTKALPDAAPKKTGKFVMGEAFEPRYFAGKFKLYDDGRRSGILVLKVDDDGDVTGTYISDKEGQQYSVQGKIGVVKHSIEFTVKLPRTEQRFKGWLFTGNGLAISGYSKLQDREAGFYATRVEEE
jgi:hypothetical protein